MWRPATRSPLVLGRILLDRAKYFESLPNKGGPQFQVYDPAWGCLAFQGFRIILTLKLNKMHIAPDFFCCIIYHCGQMLGLRGSSSTSAAS